jgi:alpha-tubulin suppressor-like RCC1 family protein
MKHRPAASSALSLSFSTAALFVLLFLAAPPRAGAKTITIKATFTYVAPNAVIKPIRYALVELRNSNPVSDDVVRSSHTGLDGSVTFQYDSGMDDGWFGGRIDPYVRCYPKVSMPTSDMSNVSGQTQWTELARVGRGTGLGFIEPVYDTLDTSTWDDNDSDRTAAVKATGTAGAAYFILDCALTANLPSSSENYRAPMALGDLWVFPGAMFDIGLPKTAYMPDTNVILIDVGDLDFDSTLHEYGHYEMCRYYGSTFGSYDCTRNNHSFEKPLENKWYLPSDAEWSALAEAWADFSPVITKRQPVYHGYNVETAKDANLADASASCEGTICRIFWDIADTWQDKTNIDDNVVDRPVQAGMALDDDPFGFTGRPPYSTLPGWDALKDLIRKNSPKSLWGIRDAWRTKYRTNRAALRALDAVFWINGLMRNDLQENAPTCALHLNGSTTPLEVKGRTRDAYVGDVTLTADVSDLEADDRQFLHVYFYWAYMSEHAGIEGRITDDRNLWNLVGVDINGSDGFSADWPDGVNRPLPGKEVCLIAVASDFMKESASTLALDPENPTGGQIWGVLFGESESGGLISEQFADLETTPAIVAGPHAMVLCDDGTVLSWGVGKDGVMGDGVKAASRTRVNSPLAAPRLNGVVSLDGNSSGAAAVRADGTVWVWGRDLLRSWRNKGDWARPARVEGLDGVKAISSYGITLAIRSDDTAWGWVYETGGNAQTSLGFEYGKRVACDSPLPLPGLPKIATVEAGPGFSLAIDKDGDVWSFGPVNRHGELGRGDVRDKPLPKKIAGLHNVVSVSMGWEHCLAACRDGSVWAWGAGDHGALGDGTLETRLSPVRVQGIDKVKAVAAGRYSSFALKEDGTVWAWGSGYLGVSRKWNEDYKVRQVAPMKVLGLSGVTAISAAGDNALALCEDGSVWAWGTNDWGAIGDGTFATKALPVKVPGVNVFKKKK